MKTTIYLSILSLVLLSCKTSNEQHAGAMDITLEGLTIEIIHEAYRNGKFTAVELTQAYLDRIEAIDQNGPALNAVLTINPDALAIAADLDSLREAGTETGALFGIPILLKDNIDTHDKMPCTAGARPMATAMPLQDSWVAAKLREQGAIILGKANLSEWANFHSNFSSSGWSGLGGQTQNPYDTSRNPCGSSAGSGVAVAANLTVLAIGTETNGSIVCPSNNNGIVGIKPTVGLWSRSGIIPISFTQDTPGPMARNVKDAAICLGALIGVDSTDEKTIASEGNASNDYTSFLKKDGLGGKRIGVFKQPLGTNHRVDTLFWQAARFMEAQGATLVELEQITKENVGGASFQVLLYEFKDGLNKYFAGLGADSPVKSLTHLIELTNEDSVETRYFDHQLLNTANEKGDLETEEYQDALAKMIRVTRAEGIDLVMNEHQLDGIIAPTGSPAWKTDLTNGDNTGGVFSSSPAARAGYPNITVPMGYIDGLPVNISIFGRAWSEGVLLEIAYGYEQATLHRREPLTH